MRPAAGELAALPPDARRALLRRLLEQQRTQQDEQQDEHQDGRQGERHEPFPLSAGQRWLWSLQQLAPDSGAYNFPIALRIRSRFDSELLRRSLHFLADRHAAFRTIFTVRGGEDGQPGQPLQEVLETTPLAFDVVEASTWSAEQLRARVTEESDRPIDLETGPVFRCTLFTEGPSDAVLLLVWHHIVLDGWSLALVLDELSTIHAAFAAGREPRLPPAAPYAEFVRWQQRMLASQQGDRQRTFWLQQLADAERLNLATDRARPAQRSFRGGSVFFTIGESLTTEIARFAAAENTTVFVVLLAAFEALLHRVSGQERIAVSFPVAGRTESRFARTAGYLVNQVGVTGDMGVPTTFRDLVCQTHGKVLAVLEQQDYHLSLLPRADGAGDAGRSRFSDVTFVLQKSQGYRLDLPGAQQAFRESEILSPASDLSDDVMPRGELGGLQVESFPIDCRTARFDLELQMVERGGALFGWLQYDLDLFDEPTARDLVQRYRRLLSHAIADADQHISDMGILSSEEQQRLLCEWNQTQREWPPDSDVADVFERQVALTPDSVAATCGDRKLTFQELEADANRVAHWLRRSGARPQEIVGLCVPRSLEMLVALLGIIKAGCIYMPLDPANPQERLRFMVRDSRAEFVITSADTCGRFRRSSAQQLCLHCDATAISECSDRAPRRATAVLLHVLYTSGSTGEPKGVLGTHAGALNRFHWMWDRHPFTRMDVCAQLTTLGFVDAVWEIFGPLLRGVQIVIVPDDDIRDMESLVAALARHQATRITLVPSLLQVLLESVDVQERLPHLLHWSCSGEALRADLARRFHECVPNGTLLNLYGCSEAAGDSCYFEVERDWTGDRVPIGRPIANTQLLLLDRCGRLVPPGSVGEIHIAGSGLAAGYLNRPDLTAHRFVQSHLASGDQRLYRTGDLGRHRSDGNIEYFGRADLQLKIRGNRVEPAEVEAALLSHPDLASAAVQGVTEPSGDQKPVAFITTRSGSVPDGAVRMHLASRLPSYMLPSHFITLDAMPLTQSGKIDRLALRSLTPNAAVREHVLPRTETERVLRDLWARLLNVPQLGVEDDFFEWGGHSILALQAVAQAAKLLERPIPVGRLVEFPTVARLAAHLDGECEVATKSQPRQPVVAIEPRGTKPPLFWIPGGAGYVIVPQLRALSAQLGADQPFHALDTQRGESPSRTESIPERARAYAAAIREAQPEGPYFLAGFCLGGVVAFETAQQLNATGRQVAFLGLVNTWMPAICIPGRQWLLLLLQRAAHHARAAFRPGAGPPHRYLLRRMRTLRSVLRSRYRLYDAGATETHARGDELADQASEDSATYRAAVRAASGYVPQHIAGTVHVFVSDELPGVSVSADPRCSWRRVCSECELIHVRGGHDEMLEPPLVTSFAAELQRCLRTADVAWRARARNSSPTTLTTVTTAPDPAATGIPTPRPPRG